MPEQMTIDPSAIPDGFRALTLPFEEGFMGVNGPIYARRTEAGIVRFGTRVEARHCNPMRICHGGWLATLMDMVLPLGARDAEALDHFLLTVSMSIDYLASAPLGAWIEGEARVLKHTARMVFADGLLTIAGDPVLRASGVFRIGPEAPRITF